MLTRWPSDIKSSEITPKELYLDRRKFIKASALALGGAAFPSLLSPSPSLAGEALQVAGKKDLAGGEKVTPFKSAAGYNNFYEFSTGKEDVAGLAKDFRTRPWTVTVEGHVVKPKTYDVAGLIRMFPLQERVYRHRCVEAWSMVIPWVGFPLGDFIRMVGPTAKAKYVEFVTLHDPEQMPGQKRPVLKWPYREGLRMDEATHPLALLAVGMYGEVLPNQNGAPLRLVVPWKYGFKGIKSIVRIRFVEKMPVTTWNEAAPREFGFYANVNPHVDHPRWSQARERRIGEFFKRDTLMFNGYEKEVAHLYKGMDLRKSF